MSTSRNGKRKRSSSSSRTHRSSRLPSQPPPPVPQSLVELLKSDDAVLQYFTCLQTLLEADVQKWKDRAQHYKEECERLVTRLEQRNESSQSAAPRRKRKTKASQFLEDRSLSQITQDEREAKEEKFIQFKQTQSPKRIVDSEKSAAPSRDVEDLIFAMPSEDEEENVIHKSTSEQDEEDAVQYTVYGLLLEACNNFRELGVPFVQEQTIEMEAASQLDESKVRNEQMSDANESEGELTTKLVRRSDHDVVADLMYAFHTLSRIQMQMKESTMYPPFSLDDDFIPCCRSESHPASRGMQCALKALFVMDVYCNNMTDNQWNELFPPESADEAIRVGMRDRRHLVDCLVTSLSGEISDSWALADRSSRFATTAVHFKSSVDEEIVPFAGYFGAKCQARLSALAEKCLLAQVLTRVLFERGDYEEILDIVARYVLSSAPSVGVEDYPRFPPVLSLCVLENMLPPCSSLLSWLPAFQPTGPSTSDNFTPMLRGIALAIHATAHLCRRRLASVDDRISDVSRVELACYRRISKLHEAWITYPACEESLETCCSQASLILEYVTSHWHSTQCETEITVARNVGASFALQVALIILGDTKLVVETFSKSLNQLECDNMWLPVACSSAFRQIRLRQIDVFRESQGSVVQTTHLQTPSVSCQLTALLDMLIGPNSKTSSAIIDMIVKCCMQLSDAKYAHKVLLWLSQWDMCQTDRARYSSTISCCFGSPFSDFRSPVVRVINLKRRHDRLRAFMAQAQSQGILVSKAVAKIDADDDGKVPSAFADVDTTHIWGLHAFDGQGGTVEVTSRLSKELKGTRRLSDVVESHWRPNDLKAFDKDARGDEALVRLSPSECACAFSHVASWKGVFRTLGSIAESRSGTVDVLSFPFAISGYALGHPLLHSNEQLPPSPVCVVLEDDAILVDRFADRLSALLEELPRDFHFCSIGYSRPKTAPIAKYSSHLGIPSCVWYLTGYILSFEGAKYLWDSLPVRGPVDSWIGLKMCANWDNAYGEGIGVGSRSNASAELPPRKELARILKFRAFAAMVPLCSQKVDTATTTTAVGRSWRQRDTDVTYSGNL